MKTTRINDAIQIILLMITIASFMSSCSPVMYTAVGHNVPSFEKKGEVALSGGLASTNDASGFNVQLAAAVTNKVAIISSFYSLEATGSGSGRYFELGAGKFHNDKNNSFSAQIMGGVGFCTIRNNFDSQSFIAGYIKPYIQPSFGFSSKIADLFFTPRIGLVSYTSNSNGVRNQELNNLLSDFYSSKKNTLVFEPGITFRIGYKNLRLQSQYSFTNFNYGGDGVAVNKDFVSVGIYILISDRWLTIK